MEALIVAVEIEERTQDSSGHAQKASVGVAAAMFARVQARGECGARAHPRGGRGGTDRISVIKPTKTSVKDSLYFDFVLDSGATQQSTHHFKDIDLNSFQTCSEIILSANDSEMICSGKGDVKIQMDKSMLILKDVRLIPSSKLKLISL